MVVICCWVVWCCFVVFTQACKYEVQKNVGWPLLSGMGITLHYWVVWDHIALLSDMGITLSYWVVWGSHCAIEWYGIILSYWVVWGSHCVTSTCWMPLLVLCPFYCLVHISVFLGWWTGSFLRSVWTLQSDRWYGDTSRKMESIHHQRSSH